jgi:hypothetical protein
MTKLTVLPPGNEETHKMGVEERPEDPAVGKWYWVETEPSYEADEETRAAGKKPDLWCITRIGSNYVKLTHAFGDTTWRIHINNFADKCEYEPNAEQIIKQRVLQQQQKINTLMGEVRDITSQLGVASRSLPEGETQALAVRGNEIDGYKTALIKAKDQDLPALFKRIEYESKCLGKWMKAQMIPLQTEAEGLKKNLKLIENRLFNVELYAGLVETVTQISEGKAAPMHEKVHLMQRRHYMDEECLANYTAGGMDFDSVDKFHRWLVKPANRDRILPFPRCVVAFRIRRKDKEREPGFTVQDLISLFYQKEADKKTYLYLRNGEQVFCLETEIDFEEELFPDMDQRNLDGKLWAKMFSDKPEKLVTEARLQGMREETIQAKAVNKRVDREIEKINKKKTQTDEDKNEIRRLWNQKRWVDHNVERYIPFTPDTVYYDDIVAFVKKQVDKHNRLVLVLQGLLDRSPVFHPHPPWQLWKPEGFDDAFVLKYDLTNALVPGEKPDFEAYRAKCNADISVGSIVTGQQDLWEKHEAEKECTRIENNWREARHGYRPKRFKPEGNPGPGILARVVRISNAKYTVSFQWERQRIREARWHKNDGPLTATFTCSAEEIFNVEAYKKGDYKKFYADPRTREEYIKWAPLLLVAEDFHAGKRTLESRGYLVKEPK